MTWSQIPVLYFWTSLRGIDYLAQISQEFLCYFSEGGGVKARNPHVFSHMICCLCSDSRTLMVFA